MTGFPVFGSNSPTLLLDSVVECVVAIFPFPEAAICVWLCFPENVYPGGGFGPDRVSVWVIPILPLVRGFTVIVTSGTVEFTLSAPFGLVVSLLPASEIVFPVFPDWYSDVVDVGITFPDWADIAIPLVKGEWAVAAVSEWDSDVMHVESTFPKGVVSAIPLVKGK